MQITDKIIEILNGFTTGTDPLLSTVIYASPWDANVRLDRKPTPCAVVYLVSGFEVDVDSGLRKDTVDFEILFADRCNLESKGEKIKETTDRMEAVIDEFLSLLMDEKGIDVTGIKARLAYAKFDCNLAGYSLEFKVTDKQGRCI